MLSSVKVLRATSGMLGVIGFSEKGLGLRVKDIGFREKGLGLRFQGKGFIRNSIACSLLLRRIGGGLSMLRITLA